MQNTFGFKDFMVLVLLLALVVMTGLSMRQEDRRFADVRTLTIKVQEQATQLGQLRRSLDDRGGDDGADRIVAALGALSRQIAGMGSLPAGAGAGTGGGSEEFERLLASGGRDESWARPGAAVQWKPLLSFVSDPREFETYAEGGEIIETFEGRPPKITPFQYADVYGRRIVMDIVCESLARLHPRTLRLEGWLAEAWQMDPEGMWLRAKIRDRACFSDGVPVTAHDVKFTFETVMNPEMDTERFRSTLNVIESVEVISDKVVEFRFVRPMFSNMTAALAMSIMPRHFYQHVTPAQFNQATGLLMGSGAYRLETVSIDNQWVPPDDIVLVRNENYWGPRPPADRLRFRIIQNYVTSLTDFENGGSHMMRATPEQFRQKSEDETFARNNYMMAWSNMQGGYSFIVWNTGERNGRPTPFADRRVRQAMTLMLDRERINRDFYMGLAAVATGPFPPGPQTNPEIEPWPYDEERARRLLAEAGWLDRNNNGILENERGDEFRWEYTFSTGSTVTEKIGRYVVDQCLKMGIICTIRQIDWSVMSPTLDNRDFDGLTMAWSASAPESDPNQLWHSASIQNQGDNFAQWNSPEADRLIELGRGTLDEEERMRVWHRLHRVIHEEQPYTFLLNLPWIRFVDRRLENVHPYPSGLHKEEWFFRGGGAARMPGG